jgi:hypothetical protein
LDKLLTPKSTEDNELRKKKKKNSPIALRNASAKTSVFLTSVLYTSDPTIGQNGTLAPSSCATANASAVFPVPGAPTSNNARPENFRDLMRSTITPQAYSNLSAMNVVTYNEWQSYLACIRLSNESSAVNVGKSFGSKAKPFYVGMGCNPG